MAKIVTCWRLICMNASRTMQYLFTMWTSELSHLAQIAFPTRSKCNFEQALLPNRFEPRWNSNCGSRRCRSALAKPHAFPDEEKLGDAGSQTCTFSFAEVVGNFCRHLIKVFSTHTQCHACAATQKDIVRTSPARSQSLPLNFAIVPYAYDTTPARAKRSVALLLRRQQRLYMEISGEQVRWHSRVRGKTDVWSHGYVQCDRDAPSKVHAKQQLLTADLKTTPRTRLSVYLQLADSHPDRIPLLTKKKRKNCTWNRCHTTPFSPTFVSKAGVKIVAN